MEDIDFLELSDVMQIHINQIANYGGANDIRDANLLESAIEQPRASYDQAASLVKELKPVAIAFLLRGSTLTLYGVRILSPQAQLAL